MSMLRTFTFPIQVCNLRYQSTQDQRQSVILYLKDMESEGFLHRMEENYQWISQALADSQGITTLRSWDSRPQPQK